MTNYYAIENDNDNINNSNNTVDAINVAWIIIKAVITAIEMISDKLVSFRSNSGVVITIM